MLAVNVLKLGRTEFLMVFGEGRDGFDPEAHVHAGSCMKLNWKRK